LGVLVPIVTLQHYDLSTTELHDLSAMMLVVEQQSTRIVQFVKQAWNFAQG